MLRFQKGSEEEGCNRKNIMDLIVKTSNTNYRTKQWARQILHNYSISIRGIKGLSRPQVPYVEDITNRHIQDAKTIFQKVKQHGGWKQFRQNMLNQMGSEALSAKRNMQQVSLPNQEQLNGLVWVAISKAGVNTNTVSIEYKQQLQNWINSTVIPKVVETLQNRKFNNTRERDIFITNLLNRLIVK
jgi:hypothetical protein